MTDTPTSDRTNIETDSSLALLPKLSATKLATFLACPRKYAYLYRSDTEDDGSNIYALSGHCVHAVLETYYKLPHEERAAFNAPLEYQLRMTDAILTQRRVGIELSGVDRSSVVINAALDMLSSFAWEKYAPIAVEHVFALPYPSPEQPVCVLRGVMDQVYEWGVLDFKTSAKPPKKEELNTNIQFILYAWAFEQLYGKPADHIYWVHLRTGKWLEAHVQDQRELLDEAITRVLDAHTTQSYPLNWGSRHCSYCPFYDSCAALEEQVHGGIDSRTVT